MILFITGDTFLWGKYTNTYAIRDAANSSASCSFNIYVMRKWSFYSMLKICIQLICVYCYWVCKSESVVQTISIDIIFYKMNLCFSIKEI